MLDGSEGLRCPCCSGGAQDHAALNVMVWDLICERGISENAESALRAIWAGAGFPVGAELIWDEMYRWDIEGGPPQVMMYRDLRDALAELADKLDGTGLVVIREGRHGLRLGLVEGGAYLAA